jgi:hypothetical protein
MAPPIAFSTQRTPSFIFYFLGGLGVKKDSLATLEFGLRDGNQTQESLMAPP